MGKLEAGVEETKVEFEQLREKAGVLEERSPAKRAARFRKVGKRKAGRSKGRI